MIGVYVLVDSDDRALYVGASSDVAARVRSHRNKAWWVDVADVWTFPSSGRAAAFERESRLITAFQPVHNIHRKTGVPRGRRTPPQVSVEAIRHVYGDAFTERVLEASKS